LNIKKKVAIVYDRLTKLGGGEKHLIAIADMFPDAPIYTSCYEKSFLNKNLPNRKIKATFIQKLPFQKKLRNEYIPLYPLAFSSLNLNKYGLIISISSGFAKCINKPVKAKHIAVCLTPPRFLWMPEQRSLESGKSITYLIYKTLLKKPLHYFLRKIDKRYINSADKVIANSKTVQQRIEKFYEIESNIVYPPVEISKVKFNPNISSRKNFYLYLGRLESYKGIDLAIKACAKTNSKLLIAGKGSDEERLKKLRDKLGMQRKIKFLGFINSDKKFKLLFQCKALLFPVKDEDFGIVPLEANAAGCPVIAYKGGGINETMIDGKTALLFNIYNSKSLSHKLKEYDTMKFDPKVCLKNSRRFTLETFKNNFKEILTKI
jgi:glycosyltransferase involved in cell wall biosynthesis